MRPQFDEKDSGILLERQNSRYGIDGPSVGDYIVNSEGLYKRITHAWQDGFQTTLEWTPSGSGGSFYIGRGGHMSYSGGLDLSIARDLLRNTGKYEPARAWFFHHDHHTGDNGVDCNVRVRVYRLEE